MSRRGDVAVEVGVDVVGEVDDAEQQRKAERGDDQDLEEFAEDVSVERAKDAHR